jgi:hypothetical protein
VTLDSEELGSGDISVTDASGKLVQKIAIMKDEQFFKTIVDIQLNGSGFYFVTINLNGNKTTKRVVYTGE